MRPLPSTFTVVNVYPHDRQAFTQGLLYHDGVLYESTGIEGQSTLRRVELSTGTVLQRHVVPRPFFAEGLALHGDRLFQLTWQQGIAFVYDRQSFREVARLTYTGEGWGLAHDGQRFILSDGSSTLRFLDSSTFQETGRITVRDAGAPVRDINELEIVKGEIFANIWHSHRIARIDPGSGQVRGWVDLAGLLAPGDVDNTEAVLNGIAYDEAGDRLFVTGKLWPKLFEIRLKPAGEPAPSGR